MAGNSFSQNQGSGERGLAPACCLASSGGWTFPQTVWELLGPRTQGRRSAADAFWAQAVAAEGVLLLLSPLSQGGRGEGYGKKT